MIIDIDTETIITIAISIFTVFTSIIIVLASWLKTTLIRLFTNTVNGMRESVTTCQSKINDRLDKMDENIKDNSGKSQAAKDMVSEHVEKYHTTR